ncbi:hypothetical protein Taro_012702 [Colocasia esculenta]|uniref:Uncharacterized protein n=1 Tax=Colocasia esculenta TaxID=4460 RepID=A0A843U9V5_COLES|nr:hypothetical protein [Colocasia esculenta]
MVRIDEDGPCDFGGDAGRIARSGSGGSSRSSIDDDLRELVRAASSHNSPRASPVGGRTTVVSRSQSASMVTIDEDETYDFGGDTGRFARSGSGDSSDDDDLRELVRAASSHSSLGALPAGSWTAVVSRSHSAGMARIDEDGPCDFGGDAVVVDIIPRSRSCEVPKSRVGVTPVTTCQLTDGGRPFGPKNKYVEEMDRMLNSIGQMT